MALALTSQVTTLWRWLFDVTSSYQIAFAVAALAIATSAVAAWVAAPRRARAARGATSRIGL